jgi:hypothetical protein
LADVGAFFDLRRRGITAWLTLPAGGLALGWWVCGWGTRRVTLDGLPGALLRGDGEAHAKTLAKPAPKSWRNSQF